MILKCFGAVAGMECARVAIEIIVSFTRWVTGTLSLCSAQSSWPHAPGQRVTRHLPRYGCALRGQNRPRQLRRSQAVNGEGSSNPGVLCGFEVVTVALADLQGS